MKDQSKKLIPMWTKDALSKINRPASALDHGVCACGKYRGTVSRYGYKEVKLDKHSRRRCTDHVARSVYMGSKW